MTRNHRLAIASAVIAIGVALAPIFPVRQAAPGRVPLRPVAGSDVHAYYPTGYVADLPARYRQPMCSRTNQYRFVAVYARAADRPDRYRAHVDAIRTAVKRANAFVHDEARRAGVDRLDLRFQCRGRQIDVVNAVMPTPSSTDSFETVEYDLKRGGLNDSLAKYWVWYDDATSTGACGEAPRTG
ncbi:MAG: hypothetical protein WD770_04985, partial [Actinomycetota bacterium]